MAGFSVANLEEVREQIEPPFTPEGIIIDLAHGPKVRFRIRQNTGDLYQGIVDDGEYAKSATLHIVTGHFIVRD